MAFTDLVTVVSIDDNLAPQYQSIAATLSENALFQKMIFFLGQLWQQALEFRVNY